MALLLKTKLFVPPVRAELVSRPRLLARLNAIFEPDNRFTRASTLISAPAGYGKTTLLTDWIAEIADPKSKIRTPKLCWLSLDAGDNDPARFWAYVIAALQTADPSLGQSAATLLHSSSSPGLPARTQTETLLTTLINDIAESPDCYVVVLDDYHLIETPTVHQGMTFLLDHCPPQLHVMIATRADPPLPLSRLRARNLLVELRAADLSFSSEEVFAFLNQVMALGLSADEVAALDVRMQGWAAGLQMAALALRMQPAANARQSTTTFLAGLAQTQRYVLDYLADEVLSQQPQEIQRFLLRTSILERLCGSLCDAILEDEDTFALPPAPVILEKLESANLFIASLDDQREWFRYHPLFADLLCSRLMRTSPDLIPQLHHRASLWYEQNGLLVEAVDHSLAAKNFDRAVRLVEQHAETALMRSEHATVLRWIESLPDDLVLARPSLCAYHAWALLLNGHSLEMVVARIRAIEQHTTSTDDVQGAVAALRSLVATLQGDIEAGVRQAQQALAQLPETSVFLRSIAANNLGMLYVMRGDIAAAGPVFDQVVTMALQTGNVMMAVAALCNLAGLHVVRGELRQAEARYKRALELGTDARGRHLPVAARALLGLGELSREWNDLDVAERYLNDALTLCQRYVDIGSLVCYLTLSRIRWVRGDEAGAHEMLEQAQALALASRTTQLDDRLVAMAQARIWIAQGQLDKAEAWVRERDSEDEASTAPASYDLQEAEHLVIARLCLAQDRSQAALVRLRPHRDVNEQQGRTRRLIEVLGLEALALQQHNEPDQAILRVQQALKLAQPEGYVRTFLDEGPPMAALLLKACQAEVDGTLIAYINRLLADFAEKAETSPTPQPIPHNPQPLIEPLSERELEVLRLLADGCANREVAEQLFISLSTVKGHTSNIYGKLSANNRTQAVARARALGLLADH